jgi:hypothetical protein
MQNIHFHCSHRIQVSKNNLRRHPVTRNIDMQTSPAEAGTVFDFYAWDEKGAVIQIDELQECFQSSQDAYGRWRSQPGALVIYFQRIRFVCQRGLDFFSRPAAINLQDRLWGIPFYSGRKNHRNPRLLLHPGYQSSYRCRESRICNAIEGDGEGVVDCESAGLLNEMHRQGHQMDRIILRRPGGGCKF